MNECPKCLGTGDVYNALEDNMISCSLCKGNGKVKKEVALNYNAVLDDLKNIQDDKSD